MIKKIALIMSSLFLSVTVFPKSITDALVSNLDCRKIDTTTIYRAIKPETFALNKTYSSVNWGFRYGFYELANCWSLSRAQRLNFYLNIFSGYPSVLWISFFDQLRGFSLYQDSEGNLKDWKFKEYSVLNLAQESWDSGDFQNRLQQGFSQKLEQGAIIQRGWKNEIEAYQIWRFHQIKNTPMALQRVPRSEKQNLKSAQNILEALSSKKIPLVVLKAKLTVQHVVLVKRINFEDQNRIEFIVYDSNFPNFEQRLIYHKQSQQFTAPEIMAAFKIENPNQFISLYLVDQKEFELIDKALITYYKKTCDQSPARL